jgi:DNA-binding CsgD family transcriptional regulator/pimeloyl-ACP methyl ester carboxylesterase
MEGAHSLFRAPSIPGMRFADPALSCEKHTDFERRIIERRMPIEPKEIVDRLYDIALDPHELETFIDIWTEAGLDSAKARQTVEAIDLFDQTHQVHLERANTFLERGEAADASINLDFILRPFGNLAAFIIDDSFGVTLANEAAQHLFGLRTGACLEDAMLPEELARAMTFALQSAFDCPEGGQAVFKTQGHWQEAPLVTQVRRLSAQRPDGRAMALVVTTNYRWSQTLGPALAEVFGLTAAEQGVVRALVEGRNVKEIAIDRGTSEGTVRGQLKSILAKMNARSQSEVIRLVVHLQAVSQQPETLPPPDRAAPVKADWIDAEVWKPFKTVLLPDGRRMDYHEMGPANGAPVLYSHMGYCMARWHAPMVRLAYTHGLRVICPIRAGYGHSDNMDMKDDVLKVTRADTIFLMDQLCLTRLPYVVQGNDLIFAMDLAAHHPDRISEIIGLGARAYLHGDQHYAGMSKWHRFFISTAKHSPHLLRFTARASVSLMRRIGVEAMFRNAHKTSAGDMSMDGNQPLIDILTANAELIASKTTDASQAYTMELIRTETPWDDIIHAARATKTRFWCGGHDPLMDIATIAAYRETYPWIDIEVIPEAGQMLIYQHFDRIIPELAEAARAAQAQ